MTAGAAGTVTFTIDGAAQAPVPVSAGQAQLTISILGVGSHTITAVYSGDANFLPSTSNSLTQTVNRPAFALALVSSPNPSIAGQAVTLTASPSGGTGDDKVTATVNGVSVAAVTGAQGTWPGLDQVNLPLARNLAGAGNVAIAITVEGQVANAVQVLIQ